MGIDSPLRPAPAERIWPPLPARRGAPAAVVEIARPMLPSASAAFDPRRMTPRQLADWAHELYIEGVLTWPEYRMVGFPSELHPRFDQTIGALTGERAQPDGSRDMIAEWEKRLAFERRHNAGGDAVRRAERILGLLMWQAAVAQTPDGLPDPAGRG